MKRGCRRAVFFDVGGTLLRPYPSVGAVYAEVARRHGFPATASAMEQAFRQAWKTMKTSRPANCPTTSDKNWWRLLVMQTLNVAGLAGTASERTECFEDLYAAFARSSAWEIYPDAIPALRTAREQGLHIGIISNWDQRLRPLLEETGLTAQFDSLTISCEVGTEKPAAAAFQAALRAAGVGADEALHVGDSLAEDIQGATAIGLTAILIDREGRSTDAAVPTVRDLSQIFLDDLVKVDPLRDDVSSS